MNTIHVSAFKSAVEGENPPPILDVRSPGEFHSVHIPGAVLHPLDGLDTAAVVARYGAGGLPLYIVCHSGSRAERAAARLAAAGLSSCVVVEGGTEAWEKAGYPVERGANAVLPLPRQMQLVMGSMILAGVFLAQFANPAWIWLAGFVGAGMIMAGLTDFCPARTLLAKAPWNQGPASEEKPTCCMP